jgi:hypothetical protein
MGGQLGAPSLDFDFASLDRPFRIWCVEQIAHDLPPDGRVGLEQPANDCILGAHFK